jgi:hypothetical protein
VADSSGSIDVCSFDPVTGAFDGPCVDSQQSPGWIPKGVTIAAIGGMTYAYVMDSQSNIYVCGVSSDGSFGDGAAGDCVISNGAGTSASWSFSNALFVYSP